MYRKSDFTTSWFKIAIPKEVDGEVTLAERDVSCWWYDLPKDVYKHKEYPTCTCGRKYVPIKDMDKDKCFFCNFTQA